MADGQDQGSTRNPSPASTSTPLNNQVRSPPVHLPSSQSTATVTAGDNMHILPLESASINPSPSHERLAAPEASVPVPRRQGSTITTSDIPSTLEQAGDKGKGPLGPLRSRIIPNHTFAEGVSTGMQAFRRTLGRVNTAIHRSPSTSDVGEKHGSVTPGAASRTSSRHHHLHSRMPRTRPILTQFHNRDQPARMFVPPPYGQEKLQEAAKVFAEGIAKTTAMQEAAAAASSSGVFTNAPAGGAEIGMAMSDTESTMSEEEPVVRVHYEIHLHEDNHTEPICPLNDRNMEKLTQELGLTAEEQAKVREIQDTDNLREYLEKIPRDYDVTIVIDEHSPGSPNVTFSPENAILGDEMAIVRRESVGSVKKVKNRRKKKKYRRPETDLSAMPVEEPRASWLELFYDLLYVANLTEFTHSHPITDKDALTTYIGWFVILWWTWAGQTFWAARYDMDDLFTKMLKLVEFWALISFGSFSSDHLHRTVNGFILSYCVQKLVLIIEYSNVLYWARRNRSTQSVLPLVMHIGTNLSAIVIWGLSSLVHHVRWRYVMWYGSILIEVAVLLIFGRRSSVSFAGSHLPERFALFTIIVLGENIIGLIGLSVGANSWETGQEQYLVLCLLLTVILYSLWWLYFDDFSEDIFHKTTPLSQLWAYLHLPLHVCMVLVGTGALDLIRLYQLEHHIKEIPHEPSELDVGTLNSLLASKSLLPPSRNAAGIDIPFLRMLTSGYTPNLSPNDAVFLSGGGGGETDYELTKQYFMAASGAVFLCNSLLKWINLRTYDKYQRVVYLTRFVVAILVFCLMAVPLDKMTPYALLGMMAGFSVLQVAVDLAVIYFGAYGFVEDIGSWVQSARSSIDLGSMLPSRVGSRAGSMVNVHAFSQLKEHNVSKASVIGASSPYSPAHHQPNSMSTAATAPHNQTSRHLQNQPLLSTLQQQQQALYNMHVNANSLGASGAYGNLAKTLSEIKNREKAKLGASDASQGIASSPITSATPVTRSPPDSDPAGITSVHRQRPPLRSPVSSYGSYSNGGHAGGTSRSFERVLSPHHSNRTSAPTTPTIGNMMMATSAVPSNSTGTRSATSSLHRGDRLSQLMPLRKNDDAVAHSPPSPTNPSPSLGAAGLQAIFHQGNAK